MDLKAVSNQNSRTDILVRGLMAICFLATGTLLIGTLAAYKMHNMYPSTLLLVGKMPAQ